MRLVSEVAGALAAGALVFVIARQAGARPRHALAAMALVPVAVAGALAIPNLRDDAATLLGMRKENAHLTAAEAQLKPGSAIGVNVDFLSWVSSHLSAGDTFHVEIGAVPDEVFVDGVGVRQAAILQWSVFQLAPHLAVEQSPKARDLRPTEGRGADWIVFYEGDPGTYRAGPLSDVMTYAPGFAMARSESAR